MAIPTHEELARLQGLYNDLESGHAWKVVKAAGLNCSDIARQMGCWQSVAYGWLREGKHPRKPALGLKLLALLEELEVTHASLPLR